MRNLRCGGLKLVNSTAQAYAEKSPVLVISGTPGKAESLKNSMLHHEAHLYEDQLKIFERLTAASAELTDPETAYSEIDRVLDAIIQNKRLGYIELPRDTPGIERYLSPASKTLQKSGKEGIK